jgi:hypothetical protein
MVGNDHATNLRSFTFNEQHIMQHGLTKRIVMSVQPYSPSPLLRSCYKVFQLACFETQLSYTTFVVDFLFRL